MSVLTYNHLALDWQPTGQRDRSFLVLALGVLAVVLVIAMILSAIPVPETERRQRAAVPPRIAQFITEKPKPPRPVEQPKPKPLPPQKVEQPPTVQRERPRDRDSEPLTEAQKTAREKAQGSGLLALHNELSGLMDTSDLSSMVSGGVSAEAGGTELAAGHNLAAITSGAARDGGVDTGSYGSRVGSTGLDAREVAAIRSELFTGGEASESTEGPARGQSRGGDARSREDVTIVFDRNKGTLYSLYARERRRNPGLQGKIVLKITIAPSGEVTDVDIVSSELNSPALESGIIARIKMFKFEVMDVDELTVTYPIEFLPS